MDTKLIVSLEEIIDQKSYFSQINSLQWPELNKLLMQQIKQLFQYEKMRTSELERDTPSSSNDVINEQISKATDKIISCLSKFQTAPPFTILRLAELILDPKAQQYDIEKFPLKFLNALKLNVLVKSSIDDYPSFSVLPDYDEAQSDSGTDDDGGDEDKENDDDDGDRNANDGAVTSDTVREGERIDGIDDSYTGDDDDTIVPFPSNLGGIGTCMIPWLDEAHKEESNSPEPKSDQEYVSFINHVHGLSGDIKKIINIQKSKNKRNQPEKEVGLESVETDNNSNVLDNATHSTDEKELSEGDSEEIATGKVFDTDDKHNDQPSATSTTSPKTSNESKDELVGVAAQAQGDDQATVGVNRLEEKSDLSSIEAKSSPHESLDSPQLLESLLAQKENFVSSSPLKRSPPIEDERDVKRSKLDIAFQSSGREISPIANADCAAQVASAPGTIIDEEYVGTPKDDPSELLEEQVKETDDTR